MNYRFKKIPVRHLWPTSTRVPKIYTTPLRLPSVGPLKPSSNVKKKKSYKLTGIKYACSGLVEY